MSAASSHFAVIIGAGFGGIGMAVALKQAGIDDFIIVEKRDGPGGVWEANTYPGAACDVPSHLYSFSFEPWAGWSRRYGPQPEIREYLHHCTRKYGIESHLRLGRRVKSLTFDAATGRWRVQLDDDSAVDARVVIPAVGQLSAPAWPAIEGLDDFSGPLFHSAHWDHDVDLSGKRVGVIGTGASAIQFMPEVARKAAHVSVFQRSAPFVFPKYDRPYPKFERKLFRSMPWFQRANRALQYSTHEGRGFALLRARWLVKSYEWRYRFILWRRFRDPEVRRELWPAHPLGCKRILFSNHWLQALAKDHVNLLTTPIERVTGSGVRTTDGTDRDFDVLILGTGFRATDFLAGIDVVGRDGTSLGEVWRDGAHAYLGFSVPGFPNLFMLYGPNTNLGHNSIIFMLERQIRYLMGALRRLADSPGELVEVDPAVEATYNTEVQEALAKSMWADGCDNWYTNTEGRIVNNWPGLTIEYARATRRFDAENYRVETVTPEREAASA
ncbi:MAG: NAD(P)/FAD-dependent oxidoreductase [Pseudomonadota bacterium]